MLVREFCAENFTQIPAAIRNGAQRIELCDNLAVGGTTVSTGVMEETIRYCHEEQVQVMALIRPRGGDFCYHDLELNIMETDIIEAKKMGVDGVVFGALIQQEPDHYTLDTEALERLLECAEGLAVTFHMAFDVLAFAEQKRAIDWLAEHGVARILTHGGPSDRPIEEHLGTLNELQHYAAGRIHLLPGGGVTSENAAAIAQALAVTEVHGTKIVALN